MTIADAATKLPLWALYVQTFGTLSAAIVAAAIASAIQYRQWRVAKDKLRLDLFDRRANIYRALFGEVMVTNGDTEEQKRIISSVLSRTNDHLFLFDPEISEGIARAETTLISISSECNNIGMSHQRMMQMFREFNDGRDAVRLAMMSYLRFD